MKKINSIFFLAFVLISCNYLQEKKEKEITPIKKQYAIQGNIKNSNGKIVLLSDYNGKIIEENEVKDNSFSLQKTPLNEVLLLHFKAGEKVAFFPDSTISNVRTWDNDRNNFFIENKNPQQEIYNDYQINLVNIDTEILNSYVSKDKKKALKLSEEKLKSIEDFITANKDNFLGTFELAKNRLNFSAEKLNDLHKMQNTKFKETEFSKLIVAHLQQVAEQKNKSKKTVVVKKAPERFPAPLFDGLTPDGYLVSLKDIVRNHKIIMLDFWGSWCQPCRMQNPFWVRLYKKYNQLGFTIISIAEETEESRPHWKTAIKQDGMVWTNIIDENNKIAEMYRTYSLPHAVLIDENGKIIYHKASARDVQEFLQEYFQK